MLQRHPCFNPSINAYFNALLRETGPWPWHPDGAYFSITNLETLATLIVPCRYHSRGGRHILGAQLLLDQGAGLQPVDFPDAVAWTLELPQLRKQAAPDALARFRDRVLRSDDNLQQVLNYLRPHGPTRFTQPLDFIAAEQALVNGHSIHPCPKDRGNMDASEARCFTPDFGGRFPLAWYSVHLDCLDSHIAGRRTLNGLIQGLLQDDGPMTERDIRTVHAAGHCLIPCHPYQHRHWQAHPDIQRLQAEGKVRFLGIGDSHWQATSSVRAIWSDRHDWMLKFSLSVRITNSIRHLQPREAVRGPALTRLLAREPARAWLARHPQFRVLREPAALALRGADGTPLPETTLVFRENPFRGPASDNCEVLATLLQDDPDTGVSRLGRRLWLRGAGKAGAQRWLRSFLDLAVRPLLDAQSNLGLLFGAHQQNLILRLDDDGQPEAAWFRDCQGTGFSALAHRRFGTALRRLIDDAENELPDELAVRLFCYYLFINSTFNVITALAAAGLCPEAELWDTLRTWLTDRRAEQPADVSALTYLLESPELYAKNNLLCCLKGLNENTLDDLTQIYHPMPNPLVAGPAPATLSSTRNKEHHHHDHRLVSY